MRALLAAMSIILATSAGMAAESTPSKQDLGCARNTSAALQGSLANLGLIDPNKVDDSKTEIRLLSKEHLPGGLTKRVFWMKLDESGTGRSVTIIAEGDQKGDECPYDAPKGYVVSKEL